MAIPHNATASLIYPKIDCVCRRASIISKRILSKKRCGALAAIKHAPPNYCEFRFTPYDIFSSNTIFKRTAGKMIKSKAIIACNMQFINLHIVAKKL
jgi:hypothetical protein